MNRKGSLGAIILGIFLAGIGIILMVHDFTFIFFGRTVDIDSIVAQGEEIPRDKYVDYTADVCLGPYGETQEYLGGFIPLPIKTLQYAFLTADGRVISAEVGKKATQAELDQLYQDLMNDRTGKPVKLRGAVVTNDSKMQGYLMEYLGSAADQMTVTYYVIKTTQTRVSQAILYVLCIALGAGMAVIGFTKRAKA